MSLRIQERGTHWSTTGLGLGRGGCPATQRCKLVPLPSSSALPAPGPPSPLHPAGSLTQPLSPQQPAESHLFIGEHVRDGTGRAGRSVCARKKRLGVVGGTGQGTGRKSQVGGAQMLGRAHCGLGRGNTVAGGVCGDKELCRWAPNDSKSSRAFQHLQGDRKGGGGYIAADVRQVGFPASR